MTSNPPKAKGGSRWGSLLSGAVAGLESRLDNIFAEEEERARQEKAAARPAVPPPDAASATTTPNPSSRNASSTRVNDRLQERLAKAVANQRVSSQLSSELPSRPATPSTDKKSPRPSTASRSSTDVPPEPTDTPRTSSDARSAHQSPTNEPAAVSQPSTSTLLTSDLPINPARPSATAQDAVPEIEVVATPAPVVQDQLEVQSSAPAQSPAPPHEHTAPQALPPSDRNTQHQEEMHMYLERIDALQAKLHYLARETVAAAKEANQSAQPASLEQKIAEKDERIALLMDEGSKLSKTEMRHLTTIKKLRATGAEQEKTLSALQKRLAKLEQSDTDLKQKLKQADQTEKLAVERLKRVQTLEKELERSKRDADGATANVSTLQRQLADAEKRADEAERVAQTNSSQAETRKISELQKQISDLTIGKKLLEDRLAAEDKRFTETLSQQKEKADAREAELASEISVRTLYHHLF